eukprot:scaffold14627_cov46-Cyclotella_meneghiniana.AAC.4
MESLRAELQNDLQSQVDQLKIESSQLKEKVAQLEGDASRGEAEKSELKQRCDTLHYTNAMLLKRQLEGEEKISQLEEKLDSLQNSFDRAERKTKYLEVIRKNQKWKYPLAIPTTSELMSVGYDEEQSRETIRQIDHIKNVTTRMRKGEAIDIIYVNDPYAAAYVYYEEMLSHYKQFANALIEYQHTIDYMDDKAFHFAIVRHSQLQLPAHVLLLLQEALKHTHFHRLDFHDIQTEGVRYKEFISNCVRDNSRVQVFHLRGIIIENSRDIDLLCKALNNKASLREIKMTFCGTEGGVFREVFNKLRTKNMQKLALGFNKLQTENVHMIDLSDNNVSNLRPTDMSVFLSSNPTLEELNLSSSPFNEQDIVYIADALRHNTTLRRLYFWVRPPPANWYLLKYAIFDSNSLNAAYDSNHRCQLFLDRMTSNIYKFNSCSDLKFNRRKKIYTILSTRNRQRENAAVFEQDGIGIKHIPQIMSLLMPFSEHCRQTYWHQEEDEVKPLSIAYEIMRDWKMPELYNLDQMDED